MKHLYCAVYAKYVCLRQLPKTVVAEHWVIDHWDFLVASSKSSDLDLWQRRPNDQKSWAGDLITVWTFVFGWIGVLFYTVILNAVFNGFCRRTILNSCSHWRPSGARSYRKPSLSCTSWFQNRHLRWPTLLITCSWSTALLALTLMTNLLFD